MVNTEYTPTDQESEVIRIFNSERANWQDGDVFVTDRVQFLMRNIVKKARKNYYGIFNQENDPVTRRKKIFVPFTEWIVETMLKNIDIDTKDIVVKAKNPSAYFAAQIYRFILKKKLDDTEFGKILNNLLRNVAIDGTGFLKASRVDGKLRIDIVDRLNMIYDPSVKTLDDSSGVQERFVLPIPEFRELKLPNSEFVTGTTTVDRMGTEMSTGKNATTEIPYVEVYERYGYLPKFVITGKEEDRDQYSYMKAIVSGLGKSTVFHTVEEIENHPFGEFKLKEVPNRMDGRGIAEMLFDIQAYINETVNLRMNKARVVHMGLFKLRGNVTPQQFRKLFSTSAIKLDQGADIDPLVMGSIDPSSYRDEEQAQQWGTRVTGTTQEDEIAGNRPATNAIIQQQGVSKGYNLRMEDLFLNLAKFIELKMMPIINKELSKEEIVRITGDLDDLKEIDKKLVRNKVFKDIEEMPNRERMQVTPQVMEKMIQEEMDAIGEMGDSRWIELTKDIFNTEYNIEISPQDEEMNKAAVAQQLTSIMGLLAQNGLPVKDTLKELFDTMGLPAEKLTKEQPQKSPVAEAQAARVAGGAQGAPATPATAGQLPENMPTPNL